MQTNKWQYADSRSESALSSSSTTTSETDVSGFIEAVENDEYAELVLETGDVLITDWEGDGVFNPYVEPHGNHDGIDRDTREAQIMRAIGNQLNVRVHTIEYDEHNDVFVPHMDRPDQ